MYDIKKGAGWLQKHQILMNYLYKIPSVHHIFFFHFLRYIFLAFLLVFGWKHWREDSNIGMKFTGPDCSHRFRFEQDKMWRLYTSVFLPQMDNLPRANMKPADKTLHFWRPIFAVTVKIRFTALKIWRTAHSVPVTKKHSQAASTLELCSNLTLWAYFKSPLETMDGSRRSCDAPMSISLRAIANIPPPHTFTLQFLEKNLSAVADPILLQLYLLSVMFLDFFIFCLIWPNFSFFFLNYSNLNFLVNLLNF